MAIDQCPIRQVALLGFLSAAMFGVSGYADDFPGGFARYDVVKRGEAPNLDGKLDDQVWAAIPAVSGDFHFPWDVKEAPLTVFKAFHDGKDFYFSFAVSDDKVVSIEQWQGERTVDGEDRVELFFAGAPVDRPGANGMARYYAIEVDPLGRVHDYSVEYYRHFDSDWALAGLQSKAEISASGYTVEGKIPLQSLRDLGVLAEGMMRTGIYRAEFSPAAGAEPLMEWISWVNPNTPAPDFHVDASFGQFRFLP